jgi:hypothetical protein
MSGAAQAMPPARVPRGGIRIFSVESAIGKINLRRFAGIPVCHGDRSAPLTMQRERPQRPEYLPT